MDYINYEIEFLGIGDADAIIVKYVYYLFNLEVIVVIDGGNPGDGYKVIEHVNKYSKNRKINLLISTHPDKDHVGGLIDIVNNIKVDKVWIHDPRFHIHEFDLKNRLRWAVLRSAALEKADSIEMALDFIKRVDELGIDREEPFAGKKYGPLTVVGPSPWFYKEMLKQFSGIDDLLYESVDNETCEILDFLSTIASDKVLDQNNETSAENDSSVILLAQFNYDKLLFTGDAGVKALYEAARFTDLSNITLFKVPHHGSNKNLMTPIIRHFNPKFSYISAKGSRKHPSIALLNELRKYGRVYTTGKAGQYYNHLFSPAALSFRPGYLPAEAL